MPRMRRTPAPMGGDRGSDERLAGQRDGTEHTNSLLALQLLHLRRLGLTVGMAAIIAPLAWPEGGAA